MLNLATLLQKRIQEIHEVIETNEKERAVYERLLEIERAHQPPSPTASLTVNTSLATPAEILATTNKTAMVAEIVKSFGTTGAAPKEVENYFAVHKIERGRNLVYSALSWLVAHNRLERREGRYFGGEAVKTTTK